MDKVNQQLGNFSTILFRVTPLTPLEWTPDTTDIYGNAAFSLSELAKLSGASQATLVRRVKTGHLPTTQGPWGERTRSVVTPAAVERACEEGLFDSDHRYGRAQPGGQDSTDNGTILTSRPPSGSADTTDTWDLTRWADRARIAELEHEIAVGHLARVEQTSAERIRSLEGVVAALTAQNAALRSAVAAWAHADPPQPAQRTD